MKIESLPASGSSAPVTRKAAQPKVRDIKGLLPVKEASAQGINLPRNTSREMIQDFSEWYLRMGKTYEGSKSYKQAISAYEKAYSVRPSFQTFKSGDEARVKDLKKG